jgi:hypothetical protein
MLQRNDEGADDTGSPLTVKLTCSAGMPWLENSGLYGKRVGVTEVTCALRAPSVFGEDAELRAAIGAELQPRQAAPAARNPAKPTKVAPRKK